MAVAGDGVSQGITLTGPSARGLRGDKGYAKGVERGRKGARVPWHDTPVDENALDEAWSRGKRMQMGMNTVWSHCRM